MGAVAQHSHSACHEHSPAQNQRNSNTQDAPHPSRGAASAGGDHKSAQNCIKNRTFSQLELVLQPPPASTYRSQIAKGIETQLLAAAPKRSTPTTCATVANSHSAVVLSGGAMFTRKEQRPAWALRPNFAGRCMHHGGLLVSGRSAAVHAP